MIMLCISSVGGNCLLSCFKVLTLAGVSCGSLVFLFRPAHHDLQRIIWQWPLQRLGLIPRAPASKRHTPRRWSGLPASP
jgi:hypothetical protein